MAGGYEVNKITGNDYEDQDQQGYWWLDKNSGDELDNC